jgi:4-amino-4-deoxy-L-arabinose transferase-like glycosyltransferase
MEKRIVIFVSLVFLLAYFLRVLFLPQNALTFGYDQARDAYQSLAIANGDIKIQGPSASIPGLYHGVFYYYVLAPAYLLGAGNPIVAAYWIALLNAVTVFLIFYLTYRLCRSYRAALVASFLFAISFESTQYAVWLSNPTIAVWTLPLYYIGLWVWLKENKNWGTIVAGIGLGLSIQAEIFLLYHIVPGLFILWLGRSKVTKREIGKLLFALTLSVSTMILTEIKFGFRGLGGFLQLAGSSETVGFAGKSFGDYLTLYLNQIGRVMAYSTYPGNVWIGALFVFTLLGIAFYQWTSQLKEKQKSELSWQPFLLAWILSHILVVSVGGTSTPFLLVGIAPAICILVGIFVARISRSNRVFAAFLIFVMLYGNLTMIMRENKRGQTIFAIQKDMLLSKQLAAIDYTYDSADNEKFSINTLTSPLWVNIVWTYLYNWHGQSKYRYVPEWHGRDQVGQINSLETETVQRKLNYLILEPMAGIPQRYLEETRGEENVFSKVTESREFGEIVVEKRERFK